MARPSTTGAAILAEVKAKDVARKKESNYDRNLKVKVAAVTSGYWATILLAFLLGKAL